MENTWKPVVAGILSIVSGCLNVLAALAAGLFMYMPAAHMGIPRLSMLGGLGILFIAFGAVAIAGGVCALQRRRWALALAGSICAIISPWALLGILSTVFVALSRDEFPGNR